MNRLISVHWGLPVISIVLACMLITISQATAQEARRLSLKEAVQLGLAHSKTLQIAVSEVKEAGAALREARENRLPDLDLSGRYMRLTNTANVKLKTGGSEHGENAGAPGRPNHLMLGQASLSVPIFSGFRLNHAIHSATYLEKASRLNAEADKNEVIWRIAAAWSGLFKAESAVNLVEENRRQARQRVKDFSNLERNGLLARNDLLKAKLRESDMDLALLEAENELKVAAYNMCLLLGLPDNTPLLTDTTLTAQLSPQPALGALEDQALENRKDLASVNWQAEAAAEQVKIAGAGRWPSIGFSAGYLAADLDDVLTVTNAVNAGLGISFNLASLFKAGSKMDKAREKAFQLRLGREQLSDKVRMQVHEAFSAYELSLKKIEVYREALQQAAENYRIVKNKHDNSLATTTDLLDADGAQLKARIDAAYARSDAMMAWFSLLKATGELDKQAMDYL